jgi:putative CocE/NonD family hydrolase
VTGTTRAVLWISSDAPSADIVARLIDVYPDGYAAPLLDGAARVHIVEGGRPQQVTIDLGTTSNLFESGHRIRIDISGSSFPKLEPNPHAASDVLYHDPRHPSYIELSVNAR